MLKTIVLILLSSWSAMTLASTDSCAERLNAIAAKLAAAEAGANPNDVSSLQPAKDKVETYCSDGGQHRRATRHLADKKRKIAEIEEEIQEAERDYNVAVNNADLRKIEKYQWKIAGKQRKLEEAKGEEKSAEEDLAALDK